MHSRIPLNLVAVSSLALLISSFSATPVTAVSVSSHGHVVARHQAVAANSLAKKKKRSSSGRCKPRTTKAASHSSTAKSSTATKSSTSSSNTKGSSNSNSNSGSTGKGSTVPVNGGGSTNSNGQKVGIAWPNGESSDLKFYKTSHSKFLYTWSPFIPDNAKSLGFTPMPMLWGRNQVDDFKRLVKPGYAEYVLGMNEPNQSGQSDMSPQEGASLWMQYIQPLKAHGYKLISPATTSAPSGKQWMKDFFAACKGCTFDGLAIHYYDVDPQGMIDYMTDFHNTFKLDIWPTEFACQNFNGGAQKSAGEVQNFLQTVTAFMEKTEWIPAYFAFGVMHDMQGVNNDNQLMAGSGKPTTLGNIYLNP